MNCRFCNSKTKKIVDLKNTPLANNFSIYIVKKYPLGLCVCESCQLIQLSHDIDYSQLFCDYPYYTSSNLPMIQHFLNSSNEILSKLSTNENDLIVEIGCNDGSFLKNCVGKRRILGIDKSYNFKSSLEKFKINHVIDSFDCNCAKNVVCQYGKAKIVYAANVIAHIPDINETMMAVSLILDDSGFFVFEFQYALDLLKNCCVDQIYHEHVYYFTLHSLKKILSKYGLFIVDVNKINVHGQSLRVTCSKIDNANINISVKEEIDLKVHDNNTYDNFSLIVANKKIELFDLLYKIRSQNKKIVGFGAPAKSTTLCNWLEIDNNIISYTVDNTKQKQNKYIPGTNIFIHDPEYLSNDAVVDYVFLFSWNYADYIIHNMNKSVKFIIPFPKIQIK